MIQTSRLLKYRISKDERYIACRQQRYNQRLKK